MMILEQLKEFIRKNALEECSATAIIADLRTEVEVRFTKDRDFKYSVKGIYGKELESKREKFFTLLGVPEEEILSSLNVA